MPHIHEKIDFTTTAYLVYNDTVLLRMHDKYKKWLGVGGHIELDEDPNDALVREIKEEIGMDITLEQPVTAEEGYKELLPPDMLNIHHVPNNHEHQHIDLCYFLQAPTDKVIPGGSDISEEWKWFTEAELDNPEYNIKPRVIMYAKKALNKFRK